jgi:hypothetical protein
MVPLCAVAGERESVAWRAAREDALFIPRLQKRESQPSRVLFWRGDWSTRIIVLKGMVVKSSA